MLETPVRPRRRAVALLLCLAGATAATTVAALGAGSPALAASPHAAPRAARASVGPRVPGDAAAQVSTSMMPASSPDARPAAAAAGALAAGGAAARATAAYAGGVDVADYQHPGGKAITWSQVAASGQSFAMVKATESTGYVNPYMVGDVAGARGAGLTVGLYHFADPALSGGSAVPDAQAEADHFAAQINAVGGLQLPPTLDFEETGGLDQAELTTWVATFLQRVHADTGRLPMIYTGPYFWDENVGSTAFSQYPLWEADYTPDAAPLAVDGWSRWTLWQWTDGSYYSPPAVPGITGAVDHDRFDGSAAQVAAFAGASTGNVAPFTGTASRSAYPDGTLVQIAGTSPVYEVAGLAPVYLPSFAEISGSHPIHELTTAQFYSLRSTPLDGTWLVSHETGQVYRTAGGAPLYITSFAPFSPRPALVSIGQAALDRAGSGGVYSHLNALPANGTFLAGAETGQVYRVVGGAPVYVSSWSYFGGPQPYTVVTQQTLQDAGAGGVFAHLLFRPANGALLADPTVGAFFTVSGGRLVATSNQGQAFTVEGHSAIANRGLTGVWAHLA